MSVAVEHRMRAAAQNRCGYYLNLHRLVRAHLEIEHFIPLANGGSNTESNLRLACRICYVSLGELGVLR
jgi:5-methylcytosine-specific restriction endonuclease McrA